MVTNLDTAYAYQSLLEEAARMLGARYGAPELTPEQHDLADRAIGAVREAFDDEDFARLGGDELIVGERLHRELWSRARAIMAETLAL
jgi:hypothetical protein